MVVFTAIQARQGGRGMCWDEDSNHWHSNWSNLFDSAIDPKDLPQPSLKGAALYTKYCGQCHALQSPSAKDEKEWKRLVYRMANKMERMAGMSRNWMNRRNIKVMSAQERRAIVSYLSKHSLKSINLDNSKIIKIPGYNEYKNNCSQCHALPSPKQHKSAQWPIVVTRMKKYIRLQKRPSITQQDERLILRFLQASSKK